MSARRAKKKGVHPAVAVVLFLGCGAYAASSLFGGMGTQGNAGLAALIGMEDPAPVEDVPTAIEEVLWQDLLEVHGSYEAGTPVRMAFTAVVDAVATAAPTAEVEAAARWRGQDPPMLRLGVVMVSAEARRAVLGGRVVGVGDQLAEGEVIGIEPGVVRLRWQQRELTYDMDSLAPREFRAELSIRQAAAEGAQPEDTNSEALEEGK